MVRLLPILTNCVLLLCFSKTRMCYRRRERMTDSCRFCITRITTYNMNTTIYWKSNFTHQDTSIDYELEYDGVNVSCVRPRWHEDSGEMSCGLLTCETTRVDEWYEIRVKARGNKSSSFVTPSIVHNPTQDNIPLKITDVNITSNSSSSAVIDWRLPPDFCTKSKYCMEFTYYRQRAKNDQFRLSVPSGNANSSVVTGLDSCSKYLFYLTVYEEDSCSFSIAARWKTGPFVLPSSNPAINLTPGLRVFNFNTAVYWSQPESCSLETSQFSVYYRSAEPARNWSKSSCIVKQDVVTNKFSCQFLTCADTEDRSYEVQVRVNGSSGRMENVLYFLPSLENLPDDIYDVTITALTSSSLRVSWELAPTFCSRFQYCLILFYHDNDSGNKSMEVLEDDKNKQSLIVYNVLTYTKYYFYAITFPPGLGCMYTPDYSQRATGPFTGTTLEDVPSSPPILICSFCDVIVHGKTRTGTVRWQLPSKNKWNGLPRVFIIQWQEKEKANISESLWNNKTIRKIGARDANLTGLLLPVEYLVRVRMCNGADLCSKFSKEMTIGIFKQKGSTSKETKSQGKTIGIALGVTFGVLAVIFAITLFLKVKKFRSRAGANNLPPSLELPNLECLSYENIATAGTVSSYTQLSPTDDCYLDTETTEPDKKSENSSQADEDIVDKITSSKTDS